MIAQSSAFIRPSPWWLLKWFNNQYWVLSLWLLGKSL